MPAHKAAAEARSCDDNSSDDDDAQIYVVMIK